MENPAQTNPQFSVEEWVDTQPRWHELMRLVDAQGQTQCVEFRAVWHVASHLLVALHRDQLAVRSHSDGTHAANHQLKLALGYGIHPIVRGDDKRGAYFVMPLHIETSIFAREA